MKKTTKILSIILILLFATCLLFACDGESNELIFKTLTVDGTSVDGGVVDNSITSFRFIDEIETKGKSTYEVGLDEYGIQIATTKVVPLEEGENKFYIFEKLDNKIANTYVVEIYRKHMYTINFNTNGAESIDSQEIEEGGFLAPVVDPVKVGYTFVGWSYDVATPITSNITVNAIWTANADTKYTVEYYFQGFDDSSVYEKNESLTQHLTGTTGEKVTINPTSFQYFSFDSTKSKYIGTIKADGSLVLKLYFKRIVYYISAYNGDKKAGEVTHEGSWGYFYGKEVTITATPNPGYNFVCWKVGDEIVSTSSVYTFTVERGMMLEAVWEKRNDIPYTIEYYVQNIDDDEYTKDESLTEIYYGTTGKYINIDAKSIEGLAFTYTNSVDSGYIQGDGSLVLKLYYDRRIYELRIRCANESAGMISDVTGSYRYGKEFTITATTNPGYTFEGWDDGTSIVSANESYTFNLKKKTDLTAKWSANTNTPYTIEYYFQDADGTYIKDETLTKYCTGTTDTYVEVEGETFENFGIVSTYNRGKINGDGSLVIKLKYKRNTYRVSVSADTGGTAKGGDRYRYGQEVTVSVEVEEGYEFNGWTISGEYVGYESTYTFIVEGNVSVRANITAKTVKYTVEHYFQDADSAEYVRDDTKTQILEGKTGDYVVAKALEIEHYTYRYTSYDKGEIKGDGSLVLRVLYDIDS